MGHLDEVTDLAFLGPPEAPHSLAVATNSDVIQLFALPGMSCRGSLLGHREAVLALDAAHLADGERRGGAGGTGVTAPSDLHVKRA